MRWTVHAAPTGDGFRVEGVPRVQEAGAQTHFRIQFAPEAQGPGSLGGESSPSSRILHSFLNFLLSFSISLSMASEWALAWRSEVGMSRRASRKGDLSWVERYRQKENKSGAMG